MNPQSMSKFFTSAIIFCVMAATTGFAYAGIGAKYATRDPATCASKTKPAKGAPTAEQAKQYVLCGSASRVGEGEDSYHHMILMENVRVEIGQGRPFQGGINSDINMHDVDPRFPIYPIRGSFDMYQCSNIAAGDPWQSIYEAGKNCDVYEEHRATGSCFKTTFGDWDCSMTDLNVGGPARKNVSGPK
ncbi:MAG: hypothetical protein WCA45_03420 [Thiobacillaceae bacterium]